MRVAIRRVDIFAGCNLSSVKYSTKGPKIYRICEGAGGTFRAIVACELLGSSQSTERKVITSKTSGSGGMLPGPLSFPTSPIEVETWVPKCEVRSSSGSALGEMQRLQRKLFEPAGRVFASAAE